MCLRRMEHSSLEVDAYINHCGEIGCGGTMLPVRLHCAAFEGQAVVNAAAFHKKITTVRSWLFFDEHACMHVQHTDRNPAG